MLKNVWIRDLMYIFNNIIRYKNYKLYRKL